MSLRREKKRVNEERYGGNSRKMKMSELKAGNYALFNGVCLLFVLPLRNRHYCKELQNVLRISLEEAITA